MKYISVIILGIFILGSCSNYDDETLDSPTLIKSPYKITCDSMYVYIGDSIYNSMLREYNSQAIRSRSLSVDDDAFFNNKYTITSTESSILYGRNHIFPGNILEGNSIISQNYRPIILKDRNPITVSMTLNHNKFKSTVRTIEQPTFSKLSTYVAEMAVDGNFEQNEKFMFYHKQFTFYDEIREAFGTNVNTKKLFSSKKEGTSQENERINKTTGMYVKFYQSAFTVHMDAADITNGIVKGATNTEPVYVNSVTYGRLGILVIESDYTFDFMKTTINKEFNRIFSKKKETLTSEEQTFLDRAEMKILILGADSDYAVHAIDGYGEFLNMIYKSQFSSTSYGVPISCSFGYANTHELVEVEFENKLVIEPLFVAHTKRNQSYGGSKNDYTNKSDSYLYFYKDREKARPTQPYTDIVFNVREIKDSSESKPDERGRIYRFNEKSSTNYLKIRNIKLGSSLYVGSNIDFHQEVGTLFPRGSYWRSQDASTRYVLDGSPFYRCIN